MKLIDTTTNNLVPLNTLAQSEEDNVEKFKILYERTRSKLSQMAFKVVLHNS
jgi:hypothetical protein